MLINGYFISNFNYSSLIWIFSSTPSVNKIEGLQKRALRFSYYDFNASYDNLLSKGGKSKMNVNRWRALCAEIYKILNNLNPSFIKKSISILDIRYSLVKSKNLWL